MTGCLRKAFEFAARCDHGVADDARESADAGGVLEWAHAGNGWVFSNAGGGWEYPLSLIVVSVAVALQAFAARAPVARTAALGSAAQQA